MNALNLLPALFEINEMQPFEFWKLQDPRKSGCRWTFDIYSEFMSISYTLVQVYPHSIVRLVKNNKIMILTKT